MTSLNIKSYQDIHKYGQNKLRMNWKYWYENDLSLTYRRLRDLIVTSCLDSDFVGCLDDHKLTFGYNIIVLNFS